MTTLRQGDRGPAVRELQVLLFMTGTDPGPLDGIFGPRTKMAVGSYLDVRYGQTESSPLDLDNADDEDFGYLRALPRRAVEVPRLFTPVTAVDMRIALVAGYVTTFQRGEPQEWSPGTVTGERAANAVRVALAQICVEHGCEPWPGPVAQKLYDHGHRLPTWLRPRDGEEAYIAVWNNNVGNRQVRREDTWRTAGVPEWRPRAPWFNMKAREGSRIVRELRSPHYAYPNLAEGAAAYWIFLRDHCVTVLAAFEAGDPALAASKLKHEGWGYTGDEHEYARGMVDRYARIQ